MGLTRHRKNLEDYIMKGDVFARMQQNPDQFSRLLLDWRDSFKAWEAKDTIGKAYWDTRLAVRYNKRKIDEGVLSPIQAATRFGGGSRNFDGFSVDVGLRGVKARMDPQVFMNTRTQSSRMAELGLHDLNAALMKPGKPITKPVCINEKSTSLKGAHFVMTGLSNPEDQHLFAILNAMAKSVRQAMPGFYMAIRVLRSEMTRVKLAEEHDIGSSFTALEPDNPVNPRFRYYGSRTKVADPDNPGTTQKVTNTADLIKERKLKAIDFKKIINDNFVYNEIVVAYRKPGFPVFCEYDGGKFNTFRLSHDGNVGPFIGTIEDTPAKE